jgi:hypothetical protein
MSKRMVSFELDDFELALLLDTLASCTPTVRRVIDRLLESYGVTDCHGEL